MEENVYYSWDTEEYQNKETTPDWFWAIGIIAIVICVLSIIFKNYLFAIMIIIGIGCIIYLKIRSPKMVTITITDHYIQIKEDEKYYQDIQAFWVEILKDKTKEPQLILAMKRSLTPLIVINIPKDINTEELRQKLLKHIEEKQMTSSVIYDMMEKLGF